MDKSEEKARELAKRLSKESGCVQHVNQTAGGDYYVSDWYVTDSTVASYENGREI